MKFNVVPGLALLSAVCILNASADGSAAHGTYPMQVIVTIPSGRDYVMGQAIILHYKMVNVASNHLVMTPLDLNSDKWYSLTMADPSGSVLRPLPNRPPLRKRGTFAVPTFSFSSDSVREGDIVLNRIYDFTAPGTYKVTLHTHLVYEDLGEKAAVPAYYDYSLKNCSTAVTQDTTFSVVIRPTNNDQLSRLAHVLRQQFDASTDSAAKEELLEEIFALPAQAAAPAWRVVALDALPLDRPAIAKALADNRSLAAIDILIQMHVTSDREHPDYSSNSPIGLVKGIYEVSSAETQSEIDKLLLSHRTNLNIPLTID